MRNNALRVLTKTRRAIQRSRGKQLVHFLHIGKTGGSAIKYALRPATTSHQFVLLLHPHPVRLSDVPPGETVFFFLRDPITRFVSGFFSRQRQGKPRHFIPWSPEEKIAFDYFHLPNQLALALSSNDDGERAKACEAMRTIRHVRDSYWKWLKDEQYLDLRADDILFIGLQENLASDFEFLMSKMSFPTNLTLPGDDLCAHRNPSHLDKSLQSKAVDNLKHWYKEDYACLELCREISARRALGGSIGNGFMGPLVAGIAELLVGDLIEKSGALIDWFPDWFGAISDLVGII